MHYRFWGLLDSCLAAKATNETKHGLSITANQSLSIYDIKKRKPKPAADYPAGSPANGDGSHTFNDELDF